jgi:L-rhamnose 1-dehydrogenase
MSGLLAGKVAAVTGGVTGIGRAIALEYLRQGAAVVVNHIGDQTSTEHFQSMLREAPKGARLIEFPGDIGKRETGQQLVEAAVKEFNELNIFVANAGVSVFADFLT